MFGWNKQKSNYKKRQLWDDDEYSDDYYDEGYRNYYKPRYDMSINLETRVKQLIRALTGKNLKLVQAEGWGSDDKYFYYNYNDLKDASDDEILGRILHQLGKELYVPKDQIQILNDKEPDYRHLVDILENNRADYLLQQKYVGVKYYAQEAWEARKYIDNPMNKYLPPIKPGIVGIREEYQRGRMFFDEARYHTDSLYRQQMDRWIRQMRKQRDEQINPAWEFCFNISALQNGEVDWDFSDDKIKYNFEQAVPFIKQYLQAPTINDAMKIYPDIKKYYPKPNQQQQEQMDRQMSQTEGLSREVLRQLREYQESLQEDKSYSKDMEKYLGERGRIGTLDPGELILEQNLAEYKQRLSELKPVINTLHYLIRSIIKDNAIKRYSKPFKRGKLDAKAMYKYLATDNIRIFKKPRVISDKKYSMAILVDQSGSMSGQNSHYAVNGTIILAEVFEMLGLPYEIIGFNNTAYIFKKFNGSLKREYIPSLRSTQGGTDDANALQTIKERILKFDPNQTYHKGIFVISDGEGADPDKMKDLVLQIEKNNNATVFGIGIGDMDEESLRQRYDHYLMINNIKELPMALVNLMRGQFKRK